MKSLRPENHIDVRSTADDVAAFLTGNAAAHGNLKIRLCLFQFSDRLSYLDKRYEHLRKNMQTLKRKINELEVPIIDRVRDNQD